jgi:DNA-binding transcriptional ArsR family regulator/ketosteroid isomerase-like protein
MPLDSAFAALGDPVRRALVTRLAQSDATVGELAVPFALTPQAISHHVGVLRRCGLVEQRREGTRRPCRLRADQLSLLGTWIDDQAPDGLASILDALAAHPRDAQRDLVAEYFAGFRTSDHPRILATLTDDVEWVIHGHRTTSGKAEFDGEIENPAFTGNPEIDVHRVYEDGPVVVTTGEGRGVSVEHGGFRFAFNDLFTFRDGLIARVDSYVVPLP